MSMMNANARLLVVLAVTLFVCLSPGAGCAAAPADFDEHQTSVKDRVKGGSVKVSGLTKVEAVADGDVLSECAFFFPAPADGIADLIASPEGICGLSVFCEGVKKTADLPGGKGWSGEMAIDLDRARSRITDMRAIWSPTAIQKIQSQKEKKYVSRFEVWREDAGDMRCVRFKLTSGRLLSKLEMTIRVQSGGAAATLVTVSVRTRSDLADSVRDRVLLAKRVVRSSPRLLDDAFTRAAR
jgi:hypothetical protein